MPTPTYAELTTALRRLMSPFSVEITPREAAALPPLTEHLATGTAVYLTFLPHHPWSETVAVARAVRAVGMRPVPHLAARAVPDRSALRGMLADLTAAGVEDVLLLAGSLTTPVGEFSETAQILDSGLLEEAGIRRVGIVGHPEGHPDVDDDELFRALVTKCGIARARGFDPTIVTQFCFAADPIVAWERRIRAAGVDVPVHVGLPGLTSPARLLRFGLRCGVGPSLKVLRQQAGGVLKLATSPVHHPDATLLGLAAAAASDPHSLLRAVHFFPFGALVPTAAWAADIRDGRFEVDERDCLRVTA
ncbi:methylenetetrahydrofolate reductase [Pseudonocardia sp. RS11V-5]|uniref:methylenetetrahydrofolate reductase n=1 Tax=Pseudonocardia terrae TaxID=2905831 RepID=UPI001E5FF57D|nr:methylenetetrahydrofolate reductase [Pseudonocardia terrae]MCE3552725.1 methylenetetrahydrofolate reductase [Pseudonocardia terrae]